MIYTQKIELPEIEADRQVWLIADNVAEIAQLEINDQDAGTRLWSPYAFEISRFIEEGSNTFCLKVTNTSANMFLSKLSKTSGMTTGVMGDHANYEPVPSGLLGPVRIVY